MRYYSFIFIESLIFKFLYKQKLLKGVSKNKLDNYKKEVGIAYMLNVEMLFFLEKAEDKALMGEVDKIRKIRNGIVHDGKDVTKEEAEKSLGIAYRIKNLMSKEF